jgi:peptidoglycan hydrolase-like protein with peptidoglycan-binding domain
MLQQRLIALHYDIAGADGNYGDATRQAVIAFQKVNGLDRDGVAGPQTLAKLQTASTPPPLVPGGGSTRVEVDVARQVLFFYEGGSLYKIVAVSTGFGGHFCDNGDCSTAVTPAGSFRVDGKVDGWQTGRLGRMYKPSYFNGNIAIHGAESVPSYPASHGCVRVPMSSADWIYAALSYGTPVYVINGPHVPAPFAGEAPSLTPDKDQRPGDVTPGVVPTTTPPQVTPTTRPPATTTRPPVSTAPTTKPPPTTTKP